MSRFEDTLWAELVTEHGSALTAAPRPDTPRRRTATRWVGVAAAGLTAVAAAIIGPSLFGGSPPAYAVEQNPDGTVTVTFTELTAVDKVNADLARLGVRAKVLPPDLRPAWP